MNQERQNEAANRLEEESLKHGNAKYVLRLYVSGQTTRSIRAIENLKQLCEEYLKDRHEIEIIDVYQQLDRLREAQIIGLPTLVKELPKPMRKIIGDLADTQKVLVALALETK